MTLPVAIEHVRHGRYQDALHNSQGLSGPIASHLQAFARNRLKDPDAQAPVPRHHVLSEDASLLASYGRALREAKAFDAALAFYDLALRNAPSLLDAAIDRVLVLQQAGRREEARLTYDSLVAQHPANGRLVRNFAAFLSNERDYDAANRLLERYLKANPGDSKALWRLATIRKAEGKPAADLYARAREMEPGQPRFHLDEAAQKVAEGRVEEGLTGLRELVSANPAWIEGHQQLAELLWQAGRTDEVEESYRTALKAQPRNLDLWTELVRLVWRTKGHAESLPTIDEGRVAGAETRLLAKLEAVAKSESRLDEELASQFASLDDGHDALFRVDHMRFRLRTGDVQMAERLCQSLIDDGHGNYVWPYMDTIWRLAGDPKAEWLFGAPELIDYVDIRSELGDIEPLCDVLRKLHLMQNQPIAQSVRGGTQTMGFLLDRAEPEIRRLETAVLHACREYVSRWPEDAKKDGNHPVFSRASPTLKAVGAWSVRLVDAGFHTQHYHNEGWISSACHLSLPVSNGDVEEVGALTLGQPPAELGIKLAPRQIIGPKPGHLALFPSTIWHGTRPFKAGERLTCAFDFVPD